MDLVEFLTARFEEAPIPWGVPIWHERWCREPNSIDPKTKACLYCGEIDPRWAILERYAAVAAMDTADPEPEFAYGRAVGLGEAVRLLALPYADRPDYDEAWRP
ncbi:DUF6221 family protein [Streptomyces sp. NPDC092046]|uniref:DUF6221 family protein n=1 Tax=Streptomyces sp. NPDC092046 TaxID=3366009 RepID=UPI003808A841